MKNMINLINITPSGTERGDASGIPADVLSTAAPVIAAVEAGAAAILSAAGESYDSASRNEAAHEKTKIEAAIMAANKELILSALKAAGVTSATVEYEGDGDSGGVTDTDFQRVSGCEKDLSFFLAYLIRAEYGWKKESEFSIYIRRCGVCDAVQEFAECDMVSYFGHSGYENNDGGRGTVTFDVERGSIKLEHSDYIMETEDYEHEF